MLAYAARRILGLIPVLCVAVVLCFIAIHLVPGDPIMVLLSDQSGDPVLEARLRADYGLDRPLAVQFLDYLAGLPRGDFGMSYRFANLPVTQIIGTSLAISPVLALTALAIALAFGLLLGTFAALRRNTGADTAVIVVLVAGISIPNFAMAAFLVYLFAIKLGVLPVAGWGDPSQLILPVVVLAIPPMAYIARLTRTYMLEVLQQDYIRTARAKGMRERIVIWRHALRNTLVPLLDHRGHHLRRPAVRHLRGRDDLQHPRAGPARDRFDLCPRLPGHHGDRAAVHPVLCQHQPSDRPALWPDRPAHPPRRREPLMAVALEGSAARARADFLLRFGRTRNAVLGALIVTAVILVALLAPWISPHDFELVDMLAVWGVPSATHPLGADGLGRDILSRIIVGAQVSLLVACSVLAITLTIGITLGMVAAWFGGWTETLIMRIVDIIFAFPELILAILVAAVIGPGTLTVIVALSLVWWPGIARLTRSLVLSLKGELFVDAAIACGSPPRKILVRHLLPNIIAPIIVRASIGVGFIIMAEATLSFLGIGVQEPQPTWGGMIRDGLPALRTDPYLALYASLALGITIIGFNLLGDGLRDILDPRIRDR